jgi:hypothetical protein
VDQRRYYVIGTSTHEHGPYSHDELREAMVSGAVDRHDQVRTSMGTMLGTVHSVLRRPPSEVPIPTMKGIRHQPRRTSAMTVSAIGLIIILIVIMYLSLRSLDAPPAPGVRPTPPLTARANESVHPPDVRSAIQVPSASADRVASGPEHPAAGFPPSASSGMVWSILTLGTPIIALMATSAGGESHDYFEYSREPARNIIDGRLDTKYFNDSKDGNSPAGINSGFIVIVDSKYPVSAFQFATANDADGRDPQEITMEGSSQDRGPWTLIYRGSSGLMPNPGRRQWGSPISLPHEVHFRSYRILVTMERNPKDHGTQYAEFRLGTTLPR